MEETKATFEREEWPWKKVTVVRTGRRERGVACARERATGVAEEVVGMVRRNSFNLPHLSLSLAFSSPAASVFSSSYPSGLTQSNYKELNVLYEKYKNQGLEILAFPCNQFAGQEPGSNEEIQDVVCTMLKAEFPIFSKVEVNGKNTVPLYKFLKLEKGDTSEMISSGILQSFWLTNKGRLWRDTLQPHHLLRLRKTYKIY